MRPNARQATRALAAIVSLVWVASVFVASAGAAETGEERGAGLLQAVESGQRSCPDLTTADFGAIGEFTMGRMLGSPQVHESMDQLATRMMGTGGLERMHQVMGQRFAGCGQPAFPAGFAQTIAMMPGMGGAIGSPGSRPTGAQVYGPGDQVAHGDTAGPGSIMGSNLASSGRGSGDDGPTGWMAAAMLILVVGAGGLAYFLVRRRPQSQPALQVLARRFAAGEISAEEYESRHRLLEGDST